MRHVCKENRSTKRVNPVIQQLRLFTQMNAVDCDFSTDPKVRHGGNRTVAAGSPSLHAGCLRPQGLGRNRATRCQALRQLQGKGRYQLVETWLQQLPTCCVCWWVGWLGTWSCFGFGWFTIIWTTVMKPHQERAWKRIILSEGLLLFADRHQSAFELGPIRTNSLKTLSSSRNARLFGSWKQRLHTITISPWHLPIWCKPICCYDSNKKEYAKIRICIYTYMYIYLFYICIYTHVQIYRSIFVSTCCINICRCTNDVSVHAIWPGKRVAQAQIGDLEVGGNLSGSSASTGDEQKGSVGWWFIVSFSCHSEFY